MADTKPFFDLPGRALRAARAVADVTFKGLPTVRAALHGARLGAGARLGPAVVERLGVRVIPAAAHAVTTAVERRAGEMALVLRRGGGVLHAGSRGVTLHAPEGLTLSVSRQGGAVATATDSAVLAIARGTARGALRGLGRAAAQGAAAGAVLDGAMAGVVAVQRVRSGELSRRGALRYVGKQAARGAVAGAVGVAAAGVVSAGVAATGLTIIGAPVALPLVTMVAVGAYAGRAFDRMFSGGEPPAVAVREASGAAA